MLVDALEHEEADEAVGRGDEQELVHQGEVVGDKQRPALLRDVVAALNPDAIKGMGGDPKQEPEQRIRQKVYRVAGPGHSDHPNQQKAGWGRELQNDRQQEIYTGGQENGYKGEHAGSSNRT